MARPRRPTRSSPRSTRCSALRILGRELSDIDFARLTHLAVFNVDLNSDGTVSGMSSWDELGPGGGVARRTPRRPGGSWHSPVSMKT